MFSGCSGCIMGILWLNGCVGGVFWSSDVFQVFWDVFWVSVGIFECLWSVFWSCLVFSTFFGVFVGVFGFF